MNRFLFRVESNTQIGMGHFYRCLALANILSGYKISFLMSCFDQNISDALTCANIELQVLESSAPYEIDEQLLSRYIGGEDIVILDGYHFTEAYMKTLKSLAAGLVVIDDLNQGVYTADLIINHGPHALDEKYKLAGPTKLLLGSDYTLLRPAFYENAGKGKVKSNIEAITICFGGADSKNFTLKFLQALCTLNRELTVNIVIGSSNVNEVGLYSVKYSSEVNVNLVRNLADSDMALLLLRSDIVISSPSGIAMEVCTLNIPIVTATTFDNQKPFADFLSKHEVSSHMDHVDNKTPASMAQELLQIIDGKNYRERLVLNQKKYFDGNAGIRLRTALVNLLNEC